MKCIRVCFFQVAVAIYMYISKGYICLGAQLPQYISHCLPLPTMRKDYQSESEEEKELRGQHQFIVEASQSSIHASQQSSMAVTERNFQAPQDHVESLRERIRILNEELAISKIEDEESTRVDRATYKAKKFITLFKEELNLMQDEGYDFMYSSDKKGYEQGSGKERDLEIQRWVKIKFKCKTCQGKDHDDEVTDTEEENQSEEKVLPFKKQKTWTSFYGLVSFKFYFESCKGVVSKAEEKKMKYPYILRFQFHIYEQECENCKKTGGSFILDSNVFILRDTYATIIELALAKYPKPCKKLSFDQEVTLGKNKEGGRRRRRISLDPHHRVDLCEACRKKTCRYAVMASRRSRRLVRGRYR